MDNADGVDAIREAATLNVHGSGIDKSKDWVTVEQVIASKKREREDFEAEYKRRLEDIAVKRKQEDFLRTLGILVLILVMLMIFWIIPSFFEAQSYSRLTGEPISTWDALWVEFRIEGKHGE